MEKREKNRRNHLLIGIIVLVFGMIGCVFAILFMPKLKRYYTAKQYYSQFSNIQEESLSASANPFTQKDFLTTNGTDIVNQNGEKVILEGVNLGGWLLQEYWMCPIAGNPAINQWTNQETLQVFEERFGSEKTQELVQIYQDNWITEWDIQNLASMGVNVLRVPFWYRNFMSDPEGTWLTENIDDNPGIQKLDWLIETAGKYGVYVILDMHGCPGGQSTSHCIGTARECELFDNEIYQSAMEKLWVEIAKRYVGNPTVVAYDIMNEPTEFEGDVASDPRNKLYDRMIKAIRSVDSEHMITVEAMWTLSVLPDPKEWGWENVIYQTHPYGVEDAESYCKAVEKYKNEYQIPIYVGEFSDMNMLEQCRNYGIHRTSWTYKGTCYANGTWYMYQNFNTSSVDVYHDPYWLMKMKWGNCLQTPYFEKNMEVMKQWTVVSDME